MDKETEARINAPYVYREFPKWKYHPNGSTALVQDEEQETKLGGEWADDPADALADRRARDESLAKQDLARAQAARKPKE